MFVCVIRSPGIVYLGRSQGMYVLEGRGYYISSSLMVSPPLCSKFTAKRLESMEAVKHSWLKQSKEPTEPTKLSVVRLITYLANQSWEDDPVR